jgi:phosphoribosyl 1,2-cyclic phosphodiesterase
MTAPVEVCFLGSGSSGNCAVVRCGKTAVLVDSGLSIRETSQRLEARGMTLGDISAIFLTHEHSDHVRSAFAMSQKRGIPVYASIGTAWAAGFPGPLFADVRVVAGGRTLEIGGGALRVKVTTTPHDGTESVCYVFADGDGRRVGIVTDLGHLSPAVLAALADCEILGLEANHDVDLLVTGPYSPALKRRILSDVGHLSNEAAADGLFRLVGPRTRSVVALHISRHNNTPTLAARAFSAALAEMSVHLDLSVASHEVPSPWKSADGAFQEKPGPAISPGPLHQSPP